LMDVWLLILHLTLAGAPVESTIGVYKTQAYCEMIKAEVVKKKPTRVLECRKTIVAPQY